MTDPLRLLGANLRVAFNLKHAEDVDRETKIQNETFERLVMRAARLGCRLWRCPFGPNCDGSCGCGIALFDRRDLQIDLGMDEEHELERAEICIARLETREGTWE